MSEQYEYEYAVIGNGTVEVRGNHKELSKAVKQHNVSDIKDILDSLGEEGWELVVWEFPTIFKRRKNGTQAR